MNVGFIGSGNMGQAMAQSLCRADHSVTVYNRTKSRAEELRPEGAIVSDTLRDVCQSDIVITMLSDDEAVKETALDDDEFIPSLSPETVHVSMSTISVRLAERLAESHLSEGRTFVSAPVFGCPNAATGRSLFILAAGPEWAIEKCKPVFDILGRKTFVISDKPHNANVVKLSGNFLAASVIESLWLSLTLMRKYGIDEDKFLDALTSSLFTAPVYKTYGETMIREDYEPLGLRLPLGLKDLRIVLAAAEDIDTPMPAASLIQEQFLTAMARGYEDLDWTSLDRLSTESARLDVRPPNYKADRV